MHRHQGYNISKFQPGTSYFDYNFANDTEIHDRNYNFYFLCFGPFLIQKVLKK
jgi:hypothetical protein